MATLMDEIMAGATLAVMSGDGLEYAKLIEEEAPKALVRGELTVEQMAELKKCAAWLRGQR